MIQKKYCTHLIREAFILYYVCTNTASPYIVWKSIQKLYRTVQNPQDWKFFIKKWQLFSSKNPHCTVDIFGSKSGHLSNRIIARFFFIFSYKFAVFEDFSKWRVPNVQQNSEKSSNIAKIEGKWRKSCNFYCYFNGRFWNQKCS